MHELTFNPRRTIVVGVALLIVLGGVVSVRLVTGSAQPAIERIHIAPALAASSVKELAALADAIAIVEVVGASETSWNSTDGRRWGEPGTTSFIYRDTPVSLVRTIRGVVPATFSLRLVGGVADGVDVEFEAGGPDLRVGDRSLVFLETLDFPTQSGTEASWTAVRLGQGMYRRINAGWFDDVQQLTVQDPDLGALGQ